MHQQEGAPSAETPHAHNLDTGLACLVMLARFHAVAAEPAQLSHEFGEGLPFGIAQILLASKKLGLKAKPVKTPFERLATTPLPAMAIAGDGSFFILAKVEDDTVLNHDPATARPQTLTRVELQERWSGELILFTSRASLAGELAKFDFTWFIPAIVKYRKLLGEILLVSFVLNLFALVTPLFFQVVMDKVLVHRGLTLSSHLTDSLRG